ncbi:hypothetical protein GW17_00004386 [Ensete ventricosum]|nr:hypothetical protein GW17_00004386 [Ensete ventricosum]
MDRPPNGVRGSGWPSRPPPIPFEISPLSGPAGLSQASHRLTRCQKAHSTVPTRPLPVPRTYTTVAGAAPACVVFPRLPHSLSLSGWERRLASSPTMGCTEKQRPASAVGAKTARPCDGCLRRRARWFCEADDAFLCEACDVSVHSANPLARRHRRVRLKTASFSGFLSTTEDGLSDHAMPAWLHGCKRKPRTPRGKPGAAGAPTTGKVEPLVPDLEALSAEENQINEEDQLLHCVPILDPVLAVLFSQPHHDHADASDTEAKPAVQLSEQAHVSAVPTADGLWGFHASDLELEQFTSDMEVLLGSGLDSDSFCIDGLGWMNSTVVDDSNEQVKVEVDMDVAGTSSDFRMEIDLPNDALDIGFDSQMMAVEVDEHKPLKQAEAAAKRKMILRLDYEAVAAACSSNVLSLWIDGVRPEFDPNDSWPDFPVRDRTLHVILTSSFRWRSILRSVLRTGGGRRRRRRSSSGEGDVSSTGGGSRGGRRKGGEGVEVPGEAADEAVLEEDTVRGEEAERGEAAEDEGPVCEAAGVPSRRDGSISLRLSMKQEPSRP